VKELEEGTVELGQAPVNLDHLVRADRIPWVDVRLVLGPLRAALTDVEEVAVAVRPVDVNCRRRELASAGAPTPFWLQVRSLHGALRPQGSECLDRSTKPIGGRGTIWARALHGEDKRAKGRPIESRPILNESVQALAPAGAIAGTTPSC
jgi:hypothetical protein